MAKGMASAIGSGLASAILYLATLFEVPGGMVLAYLALLPLFAAGLSAGVGAALLSAATATAVVAAVGTATLGTVFALVYAAPAVGLTRLALGGDRDGAAWHPVGRAVAWIAAYGCGVFAVLALYGGGEAIAAAVREIESVLAQVLPVAQNPQLAGAIQAIAGYFPAIVLFSGAIMVTANAALAQAMLVRMGRNLRPTPRYAEIELPQWLAGATAGTAAVALAAPWLDSGVLAFVARNAALALLVPYFLVGLAVVHLWARRKTARVMLLVGFYLLLMVFGWPALLVAGLGFMEQWLLLRRRFAEEAGQEEDR